VHRLGDEQLIRNDGNAMADRRYGNRSFERLSVVPRHTTPYLVYVTESKRWSPGVRGLNLGPRFVILLYTHTHAREKSLNFFALGNQKWAIGPVIAATIPHCRSVPEVSEPVGESTV